VINDAALSNLRENLTQNLTLAVREIKNTIQAGVTVRQDWSMKVAGVIIGQEKRLLASRNDLSFTLLVRNRVLPNEKAFHLQFQA